MSDTPKTPTHLHAEAQRLKAESYQNYLDFLRTNLATCFTFASVAETEYKTGERDRAEPFVAHAEQGYSTVARFLSDPRYAERMTAYERWELTAGLERLRKRLDGLNPAAAMGDAS
jgi:hypothetical protein